ncbi:hypothetical protein [Desulfoluna butyratoxydans]|uniref:Uncharacterized protein n=1 Tax=Desulfoluna butyratoxydans TaxID=231438 RepID=A0A4U8YRA8_9BACT|nr:hypothetical protein [Desulfoluna butyratoxydans]VFQ46885.1 hypothetical protein MSL71_45670 [Desulfoluna butyratoxydans]
MRKRIDKIKSFDEFFAKSDKLFTKYSESEKRFQNLKKKFPFVICPGGRHGGLNKKEVEIFFGPKPFQRSIEMADGFRPQTKLEAAYGASLVYHRTDEGHVLCLLYPGGTDNQKYYEQFYFLDTLRDPDKLVTRSKKHFKYLLAFTEKTSIDGSPNFIQAIMCFFLRYFKKYVADNIAHTPRFYSASMDVLKYSCTVGLSGFILAAILHFKEVANSNQQSGILSKSMEIMESIDTNTIKSTEELTAQSSLLKGLLKDVEKQKNNIELIKEPIDSSNELVMNLTSEINALNKNIKKINSLIEERTESGELLITTEQSGKSL